KEKEKDERDRQDRQDRDRERGVGKPQDDQGADQQHEGLQRQHQALPDEQADFFDVVGRTDHQLAGLIAVMVAERQALDLGEKFVAKVEGDVLRDALGVK